MTKQGDRIDILGVPVDALTLSQAVTRILALHSSPGQYRIATPNPEMIVAAHKNDTFRRVLASSTLNLADGTGLLWAARRQGTPLPERVTGTDVMIELCKSPHCGRVFLLGAETGIAEDAAKKLKAENPSLDIGGTFAGSPSETEEQDIINRIARSGATMLFVAFGAPKQELWIARNLSKMPNVRIAMGVGGAFDFIAGVRKRAPLFLRNIGLEWLWRLAQQPSRAKRIFTAVILFPLLVRRKQKIIPTNEEAPVS